MVISWFDNFFYCKEDKFSQLINILIEYRYIHSYWMNYTHLLPLFIVMFMLSQIWPLKLGHVLTCAPSFLSTSLHSGTNVPSSSCTLCAPALVFFISPKKAALLWRHACYLRSFQSWDSFQIHEVEQESRDYRCKILFRIFIWFFSPLIGKKIIQKNLWNENFQREKLVNYKKKTTMPATNIAGLAQKSLAFDILAAKLRRELHGEKMPHAHKQGTAGVATRGDTRCILGIKSLMQWYSIQANV